MPHDDWGVRADRWAGIRSEFLDVRGAEVHLLRHDAAPGVPADAPTQLLLHGLGGAATNWLEVMGRLAQHGPVVAPDLPGFGRTPTPGPRAARTSVNVRFVRTLLEVLELDRVVLHGNSMGGLIGVQVADDEPDRVVRMILVSPALPGPLRALRALTPTTLLRFAPFVVPPLGRAALRYTWARTTPEAMWRDTVEFVHGDPERLAPELHEVGLENVRWGRDHPWRFDGFATAATSVVAAMTVGQFALTRTVERLHTPTLLLWGDADELVGQHVIDHLRDRRPDWDAHVFPSVGHAPQIEAPDDYVDVVDRWLRAGDDAPGVEPVGGIGDLEEAAGR